MADQTHGDATDRLPAGETLEQNWPLLVAKTSVVLSIAAYVLLAVFHTWLECVPVVAILLLVVVLRACWRKRRKSVATTSGMLPAVGEQMFGAICGCVIGALATIVFMMVFGRFLKWSPDLLDIIRVGGGTGAVVGALCPRLMATLACFLPM